MARLWERLGTSHARFGFVCMLLMLALAVILPILVLLFA